MAVAISVRRKPKGKLQGMRRGRVKIKYRTVHVQYIGGKRMSIENVIIMTARARIVKH